MKPGTINEGAASEPDHQERLRSLGEHIAGVAHELASPASLIAGSIEQLSCCLTMLAEYVLAPEVMRPDARIRQQHRAQEALNDALRLAQLCSQNASRLKGLVDQLRSHSRPHVALGERRPELLRAILVEAQQLASYGRSDVPTIECDVPDDLRVYCDRAALVQVFGNVLSNAFDALSEGRTEPRVWISARPVEDQAGGSPRPVEYVQVSVCDNGPGIRVPVREHIFEPFFTTKRQSHGLGLGLAIVKAIMDAHGGAIAIADAPGGGADFIMQIPLAALDANL